MSKKSAQVRKRVGLPDDYFSEKHSERPVALDPAEEVLAAVEELISDQSEVIFKTNTKIANCCRSGRVWWHLWPPTGRFRQYN